MELRWAANYFSHTTTEGWDGANWVALPDLVTLLPYDRFISEREFGNKRHQILCQPDSTLFDDYSVIRLAPHQRVFLSGWYNFDMRAEAYSRVQLVLESRLMGEFFSFKPTVMASGVGSNLTPVSLGVWHCDTERITFANSQEFDASRFSEVLISVPRDCPVDTDCEAKILDKVFDIREVYMSAGFKLCRALVKRV